MTTSNTIAIAQIEAVAIFNLARTIYPMKKKKGTGALIYS